MRIKIILTILNQSNNNYYNEIIILSTSLISMYFNTYMCIKGDFYNHPRRFVSIV